MKYLLPILLSLSVLCTSLTAVELGYLINYNGNNTITLSETQILELTSVAGNKGGSSAWQDYLSTCSLLIAHESESLIWLRYQVNNEGASHSNLIGQSMVGPCTLTLNVENNYVRTILGYKISSISEEVLTSNKVTLPAVNGLDWAVTLEQSTDLANWTAVAPGTVTGTESLQFYRIRVTDNANGGN